MDIENTFCLSQLMILVPYTTVIYIIMYVIISLKLVLLLWDNNCPIFIILYGRFFYMNFQCDVVSVALSTKICNVLFL